MLILQAVIFAVALSLDGFGVGLSYGMRNIIIPKLPFLIICLSSATAVSLSMLIGNVLADIISFEAANKAGSVLLIIIGSWIFTQNLILNIIPENKIYRLRVKSLGLMINILREPVKADMDNSGIIDIKEAVLLGLALAMDAFGAGFAVSLAGYCPIATPLYVATAKFLLVSLGLRLGKKFAVDKMKGELTLLPGGLLMLLGLRNLF